MTGEQVVWWLGGRGGATLWESRSSSCPHLGARLVSQGTLGVHEEAAASQAQAGLGRARRPA
eukprot:12013309-Alexandrium_andersonii.AAC.1